MLLVIFTQTKTLMLCANSMFYLFLPCELSVQIFIIMSERSIISFERKHVKIPSPIFEPVHLLILAKSTGANERLMYVFTILGFKV